VDRTSNVCRQEDWHVSENKRFATFQKKKSAFAARETILTYGRS
jgi:hypothetical protein